MVRLLTIRVIKLPATPTQKIPQAVGCDAYSTPMFCFELILQTREVIHKRVKWRHQRCALNILSRASGVATLAKRIVDIAKVECHWSGFVSGTRKTTPGTFRIVEKYALLVAGASTHRMDLSQMTMLKGTDSSLLCDIRRQSSMGMWRKYH